MFQASAGVLTETMARRPGGMSSVVPAAAIALRLETVAGLTVRRNEALPEKIPTGGLAILRDGDPGEPDVAPSPLTYLWRHAAPVEIVVQHGDAAERDPAATSWSKRSPPPC